MNNKKTDKISVKIKCYFYVISHSIMNISDCTILIFYCTRCKLFNNLCHFLRHTLNKNYNSYKHIFNEFDDKMLSYINIYIIYIFTLGKQVRCSRNVLMGTGPLARSQTLTSRYPSTPNPTSSLSRNAGESVL